MPTPSDGPPRMSVVSAREDPNMPRSMIQKNPRRSSNHECADEWCCIDPFPSIAEDSGLTKNPNVSEQNVAVAAILQSEDQQTSQNTWLLDPNSPALMDSLEQPKKQKQPFDNASFVPDDLDDIKSPKTAGFYDFGYSSSSAATVAAAASTPSGGEQDSLTSGQPGDEECAVIQAGCEGRYRRLSFDSRPVTPIGVTSKERRASVSIDVPVAVLRMTPINDPR
ncbi:unnamed protein product [Notodromas monacha]|uniref:Uncharacterized protein n=1 Tax=Notodromas monacha TaxID=399045 RepID=A0A7R9C2P1_9CRUS|nr:unnamed protein product [Notodromas monacha]CAG0925015.1 unnamed protein product [Notodromas monacha]